MAPPAAASVREDEIRQGLATIAKVRSKLRRRIWFGVAWIAGGLIVTAYTYAKADVGEQYVMWWGAVIIGVWTILAAAYGLRKLRNAARKAGIPWN